MTPIRKRLGSVAVFAGLAALGLLVGGTGQVNAQSSYLYTTLDLPGSTLPQALGINDSGQIVGAYTVGGIGHGFLLNGGVYTTLDHPGSTNTLAYGINNS